MNKFSITCLLSLFSFLTLNAQIDISEARSMNEGDVVTIQGIATNGPELGIIRYIQDDTGGLPAYPGAGSVGDFPDDVSRGDIVTITGPLKIFNGLLEIDPIQSYTIESSNNPLPTPLSVTPGQLNEDIEGQLVIVEDVLFDDAGGIFSVGSYGFTENGGSESSTTYVRSGSSLIGTQITQASVNLTGLASEFNGNYQLLLRDGNDLEISADFYITEQPRQTDLTTSSVSVEWNTNEAGSSNLRYGTTEDMVNEIANVNSTTDHSITIDGLDPAEFYYVQVFSNNGTTTVTSPIRLYSTVSNSSGDMRVYFNAGVDATFADNAYPTDVTGAAMEAAIINRINAATTSIDVAVYNINRDPIVAALTEAHNNGIIVRYVTGDDTANLALSDPSPPFQVVEGNTGNPLMHNKFFVFDADSEMDSWVIMGSTNMTANNIAEDYNNTLMIQDKALAKAYTLEFNEMWGSDGPEPNGFTLRFGEDKTDNTPHLFSINGSRVESYFSPSDNTALKIIDAIETADNDLEFALLTFTYNELGTAIVDKHNEGVDVRGIIENINDTGGEFSFLTSQGVNVIAEDNSSIQLHHKYSIIDAASPASDPIVVTGSHNWSAGADTRNDENTLIIHDAAIANIFLQEFEARWCELTDGVDCISVNTEELNEIDGFSATVFPNPAVDFTNINMSLETQSDVILSLWDMNGRLLQSRVLAKVNGKRNEVLELDGLTNGAYLLTFKVGEQMAVKRVNVVR
ncbi:MAG: phospholipase D-like domain-containing protein [Saprospiraceae bacterium]